MSPPEENKEVCYNCKYWQDWNERVYARIKGVSSDFSGNILELRLCKYRSPPQIETRHRDIYTNETFYCNEFVNSKEEEKK